MHMYVYTHIYLLLCLHACIIAYYYVRHWRCIYVYSIYVYSIYIHAWICVQVYFIGSIFLSVLEDTHTPFTQNQTYICTCICVPMFTCMHPCIPVCRYVPIMIVSSVRFWVQTKKEDFPASDHSGGQNGWIPLEKLNSDGHPGTDCA